MPRLMGSGALLLLLGSLMAMTQIVSYPTPTLLEDVGWLAMIGLCAAMVFAVAIAATPKMYVPPAVAATLGLLLCASAVAFPLANLSLLSRGIGLFGIASFGLSGLACLALAVTLSRFDRAPDRPALEPTAWWRLLALALAIVGAVGLGLFFVAIANPGAILVFAAATTWSVTLALHLLAALRRARPA